jgi:hypothetical protein
MIWKAAWLTTKEMAKAIFWLGSFGAICYGLEYVHRHYGHYIVTGIIVLAIVIFYWWAGYDVKIHGEEIRKRVEERRAREGDGVKPSAPDNLVLPPPVKIPKKEE